MCSVYYILFLFTGFDDLTYVIIAAAFARTVGKFGFLAVGTFGHTFDL
jgi:hypothetical protein